MLSYENKDAVVSLTNRLGDIFKLFQEKLDLYYTTSGEMVPEFNSALVEHEEFQLRFQEWISKDPTRDESDESDIKSQTLKQDDSMRTRSVASAGSKGSGSRVPSEGSHRSVSSIQRLADARIKRELVKVEASYLQQEQELLLERTLVENKLKALKAKCELEKAELECTLLENFGDGLDDPALGVSYVRKLPAGASGCGQSDSLQGGHRGQGGATGRGQISSHGANVHSSYRHQDGSVTYDPDFLRYGDVSSHIERGHVTGNEYAVPQGCGVQTHGDIDNVQVGQGAHSNDSVHVHFQNGVPINPVDLCDTNGHGNDTRQDTTPGGSLNPHARSYPECCSHLSQGPDVASLVSAMLMNLNMPKQEIKVFDGDPADYWTFIQNFDVNVGSKITDDNSKLTYLLQFCKGKAKQSIDNCVLLGPAGYYKAREILDMQYGNAHVVAHTMLQRVCNRSQIRTNDADALWDLARDLQHSLITLSKIGAHVSTDQLLKIQHVLPLRLQGEWAKKARDVIQRGREPTIGDMAAFVREAALVSSTVYGRSVGQLPSCDVKKFKPKSDRKSSSFAAQASTSQTFAPTAVPSVNRNRGQSGASKNQGQTGGYNESECLCCGNPHRLDTCQQFTSLSAENRLKFVREKWLCHNCLKPFHFSRGCLSRGTCREEGCGRIHHTLLHSSFGRDSQVVPKTVNENTILKSNQSPGLVAPDTTAPDNGHLVSNCNMESNSVPVLLRVVPVLVSGPKGQVETLALLDAGSQMTLCSMKLADSLGLKGRKSSIHMTTMNCTNDLPCFQADITVKALKGGDEVPMQVTALERLPVSCQVPSSKDISQFHYLQDVEFTKPSTGNNEVTLLIGADVPEVFWVLEERRGERCQPYAIKSLLGWTLLGPVGATHNVSSVNVGFVSAGHDDLMNEVKRFWELDFGGNLVDSGKDITESVQDRKAREIMESSVRLVDGHYVMGMPWRLEEPYLPNNRLLALSRLRNLQRKFDRDADYCVRYKAVIQDYIDKGYACQVPPEESVRWYLPHHGVIKPHKPEKLRVVFDCAAKYRGTSLNDQLLRGPNFLNSLTGVLSRFREHSIALVADVEAMFHQVRVSKEDCSALGFLWWSSEDHSQDPCDFQMLVHIFGAKSSPSCSSFALRKSATDNAQSFDEETVSTVLRDFYVDDCIKSISDTDQAKRLAAQLYEMLAKGGFRLTKWLSSDREVMASIPEKERAGSVKDLDLDHLPIERTLGIQWNVDKDSFEFNVQLKQKEETRRGILSMMSSVFDPLGFLSPYILLAKLILQELCCGGIGWDECVGEQSLAQWKSWVNGLPELLHVSIPRCFKLVTTEVMQYELHTFSDASMKAYSAVTYLRMVYSDGTSSCSFVQGKSRLCPLKVMTIPRLELSAAVLAVTMNKQIQAELTLPIAEVCFWTDSTAVIQYIRNESRRFHTFVANRVAKIQSATEASQWHYVGTEDNPADDGSRGLTASEFIENPRWLMGPEFLCKTIEHWPQPPEVLVKNLEETELEKDPEVRRVMHTATKDDSNGAISSATPLHMLLNAFSSWTSLQNAVAWLLRCKQCLLQRVRTGSSTEILSPMSVKEMPMGKVCQVYPDKSGWVRQADVKFASKCLRRPISKLCFLESTK